jgi:IS6 family transposase
VGWYLRFSLSYRDFEELLAERGLRADHVTVWKWVQRYGPEMEQRLRRRLKATNDSWRVDETYIRVKGKWVYLYRAVDSTGATIDFLLSAKRTKMLACAHPAFDGPVILCQDVIWAFFGPGGRRGRFAAARKSQTRRPPAKNGLG